MKVRCIDNANCFITMTLGRIYEVIEEDTRYYLVKNDNGRELFYEKRRFEIVKEENKMEKTFREVIADIKEGEVWENSHIRIYHVESNDNIVIEDREGDPRYRFTMISEVKFRLKRKEYSFDEAFKAYEEGKEIESCENGYKYLQNTFTYPGNEQWLCFRNSEQMFTTDAIRGKWYIND